jgi:RNA polymerase sigma-70 factor, ECF subfamily
MSARVTKQCSQQEVADHILIQRAYAGDSYAFGMLVDRYQRTLYSFVNTYLGKDEADDVVQFVWLQCYRCLSKLQADHPEGWKGAEVSLKAWLFRVAWNRCLDEMRRRKRQPVHFFSELESFKSEEEELLILTTIQDPTPLPEEWAERHDVQSYLREAIERLPATYRAVVWLRYAEDLTFPEIGRRLSIPTVTAKTYYHRARVKLRDVLNLAKEEVA